MKNDYDALTALMMGESASAASQMPKITYGPMNEVYLGGSAVAGIQSVMDQIVQVLTDDPSTIMARNPLTKKLEDEVQKAFGFKRVVIEWKSTGGVTCLEVSMVVGNYGTEKFSHMKDPSFKQGNHSKGFYDKDHKGRVYIFMDTGLVTEYGCTSREMMALLLHEIGHSFDYTPARLISDIYNVATMIIGIVQGAKLVQNLFKPLEDNLTPGLSATASAMSKVSGAIAVKQILMIPINALPFTKEVYMKLMTIREYILSFMPPIQPLAKFLKTSNAKVVKFLTALTEPLRIGLDTKRAILSLGDPANIIFKPISILFNVMTKQREIYADSFAATYGYGEELAFALNKMDRGNAIPNVKKDISVFSGFYDLVYCRNEFAKMVSTGTKTPTTMKRMRRMIDKLERDIKTDNVDPELRADLQLQLTDLQKAYDYIVETNETNYTFISAMFTKLMAAYYDSSIGQVFDFDSSFAE